MTRTFRWQCLGAAGLGLLLTLGAGCQTWVPATGQTLPSGWYLQHPPQYLPPSPPYPLERELGNLEAAIAAQPPAPGVNGGRIP